MLNRILLAIARAVLERVLSDLLAQFNVVREQAHAPVQNIIQQVTGGIWRGKGADAFVDQLTSMIIPDIAKVSDTITVTRSNVARARDIIDQADERVSQLVKSRLDDTFTFY